MNLIHLYLAIFQAKSSSFLRFYAICLRSQFVLFDFGVN